jgi:hypothetical protein
MTGAWLGVRLGWLTGAAFMWISGFDPLIVAGPLASGLLSWVGGVEGAVAGAVNIVQGNAATELHRHPQAGS